MACYAVWALSSRKIAMDVERQRLDDGATAPAGGLKDGRGGGAKALLLPVEVLTALRPQHDGARDLRRGGRDDTADLGHIRCLRAGGRPLPRS